MADPDATPFDRGAPLVATTARWLGFTVGAAAVLFGLGQAYVAVDRSKHHLSGVAPWLGAGCVAAAILAYAMLRAEESRLARELRTARAGTPAIRAMVLGRREKMPPLLRWLSTSIGTAAVLLADADRSSALGALASSSPLMSGGRLALVRRVVEADADRAASSAAMLGRCIETLRAMPPIGNVEADRYKAHVLVKALLEKGDAELADGVYADLAASKDEEVRVYAVWLAAWFELEGGLDASEGELRLALLLAKTQGAVDLAKKLDVDLAARSAPASA